MQALKSKPAVDPKRPPYPVKGKTLRGTVKEDAVLQGLI